MSKFEIGDRVIINESFTGHKDYIFLEGEIEHISDPSGVYPYKINLNNPSSPYIWVDETEIDLIEEDEDLCLDPDCPCNYVDEDEDDLEDNNPFSYEEWEYDPECDCEDCLEHRELLEELSSAGCDCFECYLYQKMKDNTVLLDEQDWIGDPTASPDEEIGQPMQRVGGYPEREEGKFEFKAKIIGALVDEKELAYGRSVDKAFRLMKIYLEQYDNGNGTYTIPEELLQHLLLMVRIIDKQNRIFNNPKFDLMGESPYSDLAGYSLLGLDMSDKTSY